MTPTLARAINVKGLSVTQNSGRDFDASRHIVELFDNTESLVDCVAAFLKDGLKSGDSALVLMRLAHWNSVASKLTSQDLPLSDAIASGQLTVLDGARTLARIMLHGAPCRGLFDEVIAKTIRRICIDGVRLRVYADMVDILAGDGDFHGAHELEKMWSDLGRQEPVTVLCGYSAASFYHPDADETFRSLCASHTNSPSDQVTLTRQPPRGFDRRT